jgi:hypothetical protein
MQVHMTATCAVQLPPTHPLLPQLQMATANAANALLHTALMQQQDTALLQLLVENHEFNQLFVKLAAAALGADNSSSSSGSEACMPLLPAPTAAEYEVTLLAGVVSKQLGLNSSSSSVGDVNSFAAGGSMLVGAVTAECQLAAALLWHQHQQVLCLSGSLPNSQTSAICQDGSSSSRVLPVEQAFLQSSSSSHMQAAAAAAAQDNAAASRSNSDIRTHAGAVYGLSAAQLIVLSQGCGGGLLQLLLLDSVRLLLLRFTAQQHKLSSSLEFEDHTRQQQQQQQQQQWYGREVLVVLQNAVATAGSSSNSLLAEAAVGCLASLYSAAAADMHAAVAAAAAAADETTDDEDEDHHSNNAAAGIASTCAGYSVASSAWNKHVLDALLQRLCQRAVTLRAAAQQAQQTAAAGGQSSGQTAGVCNWLADVDCQQQCQAWCCDAQLLLSYIQLIHAADCVLQADVTAGGDAAAGGSSSSSNQQSELMTGLQQLLAPLVERQQLVPFLCWAAARSSWVEDCAAAASYANAPQQQLWHQQQEQWQSNGAYGQQQQRLGMSAAAAAACCLQLSHSKVSLQLLAALLHCGCFARQLPWLQQQLQQQLWAVSQQQQQQQGPAGFPGSTAAAAAAGCNNTEFLLQQLLAAGGLQGLSAVEVVDGLAVGLLRPNVVQLLLPPAASPGVGSACAGNGGDGGNGVLGVVDCQALLDAVAHSNQQQQQQQQQRP